MIARFYPDGPPTDTGNATLPYSKTLIQSIEAALALPTPTEYPELVKPFQERCGSLMYSCNSCRPDICFTVHSLCRVMSRPSPACLRELDYVFAYLHKTRSLGITYDAVPTPVAGKSDASFEVHNSTSGWTINWQSATISWGSRRQKCTALSSCEAEIIALSEACKDMIFYRRMLSRLSPDSVTGPVELATDNKSALNLAYNPEHHDKTKHVERRHFFVRDMVEQMHVRVPYVPTDENESDFFTKALDKTKFLYFRSKLMNETSVSRAATALVAALFRMATG